MADQQAKRSAASSSREPTVKPEADLIDHVLVIWRYRWMILLLCIIATAVTVALILRKPRRYQSVATIVPPVEILQKQAGGAVGLGALGNSMLRNIIDGGSIAGMYVEILQSREVADAIVDKFDLMHVYEDVTKHSRARKELWENTSIETTDQGAVRIAVRDVDPNRAAAMVGAYVDELDRRNKKLMSSQATSKRVFLESRLKEIEARLSGIENIPAHEAQVQEMLYELLIRECELAKIEEAKSMPTLQVLDGAVVPEVPMGRNMIRKGAMAGLGAFVGGAFLAFAFDYGGRVRRQRGRGQSHKGGKLCAEDGQHTLQRGDKQIPVSDVPEVMAESGSRRS